MLAAAGQVAIDRFAHGWIICAAAAFLFQAARKCSIGGQANVAGSFSACRASPENRSMRLNCRIRLASAVALASLVIGVSHAQVAGRITNVVLVHGAWADGSGWQRVHDLLGARGYTVSIVQMPLSSLDDDVAAVDRVLARQNGPVLLVGHSYGGMVITEAGDAPNVAGLVYVAALVPDVGESLLSMTEGGLPPPLQPSADGYLFFDPAIFPKAFAQDLGPELGAFLATAQKVPAAAAFGGKITQAAWKSKPAWHVIGTEDHIIPAAAQRVWAARAGATVTEVAGSHAVFMSQPAAVADAIDHAARGIRK